MSNLDPLVARVEQASRDLALAVASLNETVANRRRVLPPWAWLFRPVRLNGRMVGIAVSVEAEGDWRRWTKMLRTKG
jgi:hypothetical protein